MHLICDAIELCCTFCLNHKSERSTLKLVNVCRKCEKKSKQTQSRQQKIPLKNWTVSKPNNPITVQVSSARSFRTFFLIFLCLAVLKIFVDEKFNRNLNFISARFSFSQNTLIIKTFWNTRKILIATQFFEQKDFVKKAEETFFHFRYVQIRTVFVNVMNLLIPGVIFIRKDALVTRLEKVLYRRFIIFTNKLSRSILLEATKRDVSGFSRLNHIFQNCWKGFLGFFKTHKDYIWPHLQITEKNATYRSKHCDMHYIV